MKKIFSILIFAMFISCAPHHQSSSTNSTNNQDSTSNVQHPKLNAPIYSYSETNRGISVIVVDSCEYVYCEGSSIAIVHKNNCRFCKERNQNKR